MTFLAQICLKRKLGFEIQKTNVGIKISMLEIPWVPIFKQNENLWLYGLKFAQKWILRSEFQKSKPGFEINTCNIPFVSIFSQNGQLIFRLKFREIAQLRAIFWSKLLRVLQRDGWRLKELDGGGWSWVEVIVSIKKSYPISRRKLQMCLRFTQEA